MLQNGLNEDEVVATSLRMPRQMRDNLKIQAIKAGRTYTAYAVMILQRALETSDAQVGNEQDRQGGNPDGL